MIYKPGDKIKVIDEMLDEFLVDRGLRSNIVRHYRKYGYLTIRKVYPDTPKYYPYYCFVGFNNSEKQTIDMEWGNYYTELVEHDFSMIERPKSFKIKKK